MTNEMRDDVERLAQDCDNISSTLNENSIVRDLIEDCAKEMRALLAETDALRDRLTIYEGQEGTPLGMTGVVADMAAEIEALKAAQVACVKPLEWVKEYTSDGRPAWGSGDCLVTWMGDNTFHAFNARESFPMRADAIDAEEKWHERRILSALTMRSEAEVKLEVLDMVADKLRIMGDMGGMEIVNALKRETGQ